MGVGLCALCLTATPAPVPRDTGSSFYEKMAEEDAKDPTPITRPKRPLRFDRDDINAIACALLSPACGSLKHDLDAFYSGACYDTHLVGILGPIPTSGDFVLEGLVREHVSRSNNGYPGFYRVDIHFATYADTCSYPVLHTSMSDGAIPSGRFSDDDKFSVAEILAGDEPGDFIVIANIYGCLSIDRDPIYADFRLGRIRTREPSISTASKRSICIAERMMDSLQTKHGHRLPATSLLRLERDKTPSRTLYENGVVCGDHAVAVWLVKTAGIALDESYELDCAVSAAETPEARRAAEGRRDHFVRQRAARDGAKESA